MSGSSTTPMSRGHRSPDDPAHHQTERHADERGRPRRSSSACHASVGAQLPPLEPERAEHRELLTSHPHRRHERVDDRERRRARARNAARARGQRLHLRQVVHVRREAGPEHLRPRAPPRAPRWRPPASTPSAQSIDDVGVDLVRVGDPLEVLAAQQHAPAGRAPLVDHREDGGADHRRPQRAGGALDLDLVAHADARRRRGWSCPSTTSAPSGRARARRASSGPCRP